MCSSQLIATLLHTWLVAFYGGVAVSSWWMLLLCDRRAREGCLRLAVGGTSFRMQFTLYFAAGLILPSLLFLPVSSSFGYYVFPDPGLKIIGEPYPHCGRIDLVFVAAIRTTDTLPTRGNQHASLCGDSCST